MSSRMESWPRKHRITVDEYYRMAEVGLLAPDARVELIEGEIIDMAPMGSNHTGVVHELAGLLAEATRGLAQVRLQSAVTLDYSSQPEPDLALVLPRADHYRKAHPSPADILLLVEVSDSTLRHDRDVKVPLYARHRIPEVWIVDLQHRELHAYSSPEAGVYLDTAATGHPGLQRLRALPSVAVDLSGIVTG